jgi:hypothetical protein
MVSPTILIPLSSLEVAESDIVPVDTNEHPRGDHIACSHQSSATQFEAVGFCSRTSMGNIIRAQTGEVLRSPTVAIEKVSVREFEQSNRRETASSGRNCRHPPGPPGGLQKMPAPGRPTLGAYIIDLASGPRNRRDRPTLGGNNGRETRRVQPKSKRTIKHVVSVHKEKSFHPLRLSVGKNFGQGRATSSGPADIPGRRRAIDPFTAPARPAVQWSGAG